MAIDVATAHQKFTAPLQKAQLRDTPQRQHILDIFLATTEPVTYDELHGLARRKDPRIGFTTVYRALKLMVECGLACEVEPLAQAKCPRCSIHRAHGGRQVELSELWRKRRFGCVPSETRETQDKVLRSTDALS